MPIFAITSLYAVGASIHGTAQIHYTRFPGEGGDWPKWNENEREIFVAGYVTGQSAGIQSGCGVHNLRSDITKPEDNVYANYLKVTPDYSRPLSFYSDRITRFYTENQGYYKIPAYLLMRALSDEKDGTQKDLMEIARSVNPS
jgi:hypothetical protein